ncbi:diheme cytochrome c-553 [Piscinibacter sakaiensis]|uniref:diheme cytochrome c-553 n=1 Tax=Piscinibacter sakaiensis TaxID=1547922 RepID=UPI003AABFC20
MRRSFEAALPFTFFASACAALTLSLALPDPAVAAGPAKAEKSKGGKVERGRYLVSTSGCHDCHTPWVVGPDGPGPDMTRALSGHPQDMVLPPAPKLPEGPWLVVTAASNTAFSGPWGVSFTANLTPDAKTGTGDWTERNFVDAIRTGKHQGRGRDILPPMPWQVYRNFTDDDLKSIYAYLRTIPAIRNQVPEPLAPAATTGSAQK